MDLVRDNLGRTRADPGFRDDHKNSNDALLGDQAPPDLYVAS